MWRRRPGGELLLHHSQGTVPDAQAEAHPGLERDRTATHATQRRQLQRTASHARLTWAADGEPGWLELSAAHIGREAVEQLVEATIDAGFCSLPRVEASGPHRDRIAIQYAIDGDPRLTERDRESASPHAADRYDVVWEQLLAHVESLIPPVVHALPSAPAEGPPDLPLPTPAPPPRAKDTTAPVDALIADSLELLAPGAHTPAPPLATEPASPFVSTITAAALLTAAVGMMFISFASLGLVATALLAGWGGAVRTGLRYPIMALPR